MLQENIMSWHQEKGGHAGASYKPHALRIFHEVVELCLAEGAGLSELIDIVHEEINKSLEKGEYGNLRPTGEEVADVSILLKIYSGYAGITIDHEEDKKMNINYGRHWRADVNGVLWRIKE